MKIEIGDTVDPSLWNEHAGRFNKLTEPCVVTNVRESRGCQSGVLVSVRGANGNVMTVDSDWFNPEMAKRWEEQYHE